MLLIPALWLLIYWLRHSNKPVQHWEQILPSTFQTFLLRPLRHETRHWPVTLLSAASLCLGVSLSQPYWDSSNNSTTGTQLEPLVLVLPVTTASLVADQPPSRLQRMQHKVLQLSNHYPLADIGIVVYAGSVHTLLPLSSDRQALQNLLFALHPSIMPLAGEEPAAALQQAQELLQRSHQPHGQVLLFTHGLSHSQQQDIQKFIRTSPYQLALVGIGTTQGAPLIDSQTSRLLTDAQGNTLISRLNETELQAFSKKNSIPYTSLSHDNQDIQQLQLALATQRMQLRNSNTQHSSQGYWLLLPLLLLLAPLARKGWLFCFLAALLLLPPTTYASLFPPAKNPLQLIQANPEQALHELQDPMWLGIAAYHAGHYQQAVSYFQQLDSAMAHYNQGNAWMQLANYPQAIASYQQALTQQPELRPALDNLQLAQQLLEQQTNTAEPTAAEQTVKLIDISAPLALGQPDEQTSAAEVARIDQPVDMQTWLEHIPDNPGELLRRKFWHEHYGTGTP